MEWGALCLLALFWKENKVRGSLVENIKAKSLNQKASQLPCNVRLSSNFHI
jgi:hypothetical protein